MSDSGKAVFLSYASQDAEAAKRIADALRGAGVEVWFDAEGGLEHGDEWDAKIRRQIKECVLFIPLISANTQAREEGYFRIEWELAAQRALGIASGVAFILPVLVDDTREPDALVPDRFRTVQWTKLPGGNVPPDVLQRFLKLWSHRTGALKHAAQDLEAGRPRSAEERGGGTPPPDNFKPGLKAYAFVAVAIAIVVAGLGWWFLCGSTPVAVAPISNLKSQISNAAPVAAPSEARQLTAKAHALFDALDAARDDYKLAEELVAQAKVKDATDAEVWAAESQLHGLYLARGWDTSNARRESARAASQRALRLDPQSFEARLAQALLLGYTGREGEEKERLLRELRREHPTDHRVLRALFSTLERRERLDEALPIADEVAALPGGDPLALYNKSLGFWFAGRTAEAETAIQATLAQKPFTGALLMAAWYRTVLHGDTDGARALLDRIAPDQMMEDRAAFFAYIVELFARQPDAALVRLKAVPRDWLNDFWFRGPKGLLFGNVQAMAGRAEAAAGQWTAALKLVDERLAASPNNGDLAFCRVLLLAKLGQTEEAKRQFTVLVQMAGVDPAGDKPVLTWVTECCALLGRKADAIRQISLGLKQRRRAVDYTAASLRLDPRWDSLRTEPEFAALVAEAEAIESAAAGKSAVVPKVDDKSVAVLAFANLSDDKDNEYFSDGVAEELLTVLQKIPGLHVAARTSAFSFKGKTATAQEIGEKLGVATLVEGSVRKAGSSVRITARLSRAATGEQLWSESYTRDLKDVFAVQSELAETIVGQLRGQLGSTATKAEIQAQVQAAEKGGTKNVEAHELYLQGKYFLNRATLEDVEKATTLLQRAVELDPDFALAWAALSGAGWFRGGYGLDRRDFDEGFALARRAADRALTIEPALVAGLNARLDLQTSIDFDWVTSRETLRHVQQLAPNDPSVVFRAAQLAFSFGQLPRAEELSRQAAALDPVNPLVYTSQGYILLALHRFDDAIAAFRRVQELSPASPWGHAGVAMALVASGRGDEAVTEGTRSTIEWSRLYSLSLARWAQKNRPEADRVLAQFVGANAEVAAYQIACVYAYRGEADKAFEWLERAYRQHDPGLGWGKQDFFLQAMHADPRWDVLMHKIGLADDQLK